MHRLIDFIDWFHRLISSVDCRALVGLPNFQYHLSLGLTRSGNISIVLEFSITISLCCLMADPTCLYMLQQPQAVNVLMWARAERQGAYCHPIWLWRIWVLMIEWHVLRIPACVILFLYIYMPWHARFLNVESDHLPLAWNSLHMKGFFRFP